MQREAFFCDLILFTSANVSVPVFVAIGGSWNLYGPYDTNTRVSEFVLVFLFVKPIEIWHKERSV